MKLKSLLFLFVFLFAINPINGYSKKDTTKNLHVASFWEKDEGSNIIRCLLCPRKCVLGNNQRGVCTVRINKNGTLYTLGYSNPVAAHIDPIEKKPLFHVMPGEPTFSIAVAGCNMRCLFCQNWQISQSKPDETLNYNMPPKKVIEETIKNNCKFVVYTYTEPTVFYEYMFDTARMARARGLKNAIHSCGYINPKPLKQLLPYIDAINVDLKGFTEEFYEKMGLYAKLEPVLNTLKIIKESGTWLEITNLIIPSENDDPNKIEEMCVWIKENLGDDTPLHFSRFYPHFKLKNLPPTPIKTLEKAYNIAKRVGLKYVYIGNVPGHDAESTYCPRCKKLLVKRIGYRIKENNIKNSRCKFCNYKISGIWE